MKRDFTITITGESDDEALVATAVREAVKTIDSVLSLGEGEALSGEYEMNSETPVSQ